MQSCLVNPRETRFHCMNERQRLHFVDPSRSRAFPLHRNRPHGHLGMRRAAFGRCRRPPSFGDAVQDLVGNRLERCARWRTRRQPETGCDGLEGPARSNEFWKGVSHPDRRCQWHSALCSHSNRKSYNLWEPFSRLAQPAFGKLGQPVNGQVEHATKDE